MYLIFGIFFMTSMQSSAQVPSVEQLLKRATSFYSNASTYQIDMTFNMYRGLTGNNVTKSYQVIVEKDGNFTKRATLGTQVYNFPTAKLVVDKEKKKIIYSKPEIIPGQETPVDISGLLKYYGKNKVLDQGEVWICEMEGTENSSRLQYGKIILAVNKKDYSLARQELYFSDLVPFSNNENGVTENDNARLIIELTHNPKPEIKNKRLDDFLLIRANDRVELQSEFADYQLIDQVKNNK